MTTGDGYKLNDAMLVNRIDGLVNQFYKILPIKESGEPSLTTYMKSLQREMLGCKSLISALDTDAQYLSLLSILQYLIDNDCDTATVKSDVFKAINILNKMKRRFDTQDGGDPHERVG